MAVEKNIIEQLATDEDEENRKLNNEGYDKIMKLVASRKA